ncbi:MAG: MFS transporter [Proteobacteria bacterium]|nr:MFS transporter [Pseudomonadota bacterium]
MSDHAPHPLFRYRWLIFSVLALAYFFVYFHRLSLSVVADTLVDDFNTTAGTMGLLGSIYFYCYAAMQLPAGLLSDSVGPRRTVTFFLIAGAVGSILFGLAPTIEIAFVGRILVGLGVSMVFIPTMKILSQWFYPHEFATMTGILNAVGGVGVLAATWLLAIMTGSFGWRLSFELIGGCTFVLVFLLWVIVRDRPQDNGWPSIEDLDNRAGSVDLSVQTIGLWAGLKKVFSHPRFWPLALWFFFDNGIFFGFGGLWGGPYLMHVYGLSRNTAGSVLSMIAWGMIFGSPLMGFFSDRVVKSRKIPIVMCSTLLVLLITGLYLCPTGLPLPLLYVVFFVFAVCAAAIVAIGFTSAKELFPVNMAGTSVGMVNLFPFIGGAVYMPLLGALLDAYPASPSGVYSTEGYTRMLLVLLISALIALGCALMIKETHIRRQSSPGRG